MKKKGFSLVELLAVIVIIGIIAVISIVSVTRYIEKAKKEKVEQNKKNVAMAAELYLQSNRELYPNLIGEETFISISNLRKTNYLKEDVTNEKGESCMTNSFVRIFKLDMNDYSYTTYLYCGDDKVPEDIPIPEPVVDNFKYTGGSINESGQFNDVKNVKFSFQMKGASDDEKVGIYSYRYIISVSNNNEGSNFTDVYDSGSIKGNLMPTITVNSKNLSSYVDVTGYTKIRVKVTVINDQGGQLEYSSTSGEFIDKEKPICGDVFGDAADDNDWISKKNVGVNTTSDRSYPLHISVGCSDGNGSGCKRSSFDKTWPNNSKGLSGIDYKYGTRWGSITIKDNATNSNSTNCYVRANIDVQAPKVTVKIYKAKKDGTRGSAVKTFEVRDKADITSVMPSGTISATDFIDLTGTDDKWMNAQKYPNGLIIDATVEDNLYLYSYEWDVNEPLSTSTTVSSAQGSAEQDNNVSNTGLFNNKGIIDRPRNNNNNNDLKKAEHGLLTGEIKGLRLHREGKRYGKLVVCDKAGNCTTVNINANIDYTAPTCGTISGQSTEWTNSDRSISVACSGETNQSGCTKSTFEATFSTTKQTSSITITDNAGNTKKCDVDVYVDKTVPTGSCTVSGSYTNNSTNSYSITVNSSNDDHSGIKTISYKKTGDSEFNSNRTMSLDCGNSGTKEGWIKLEDNVGNTKKIKCSGSISVPTCCSSKTNWIDGTTCSKTCGGGTYNRYRLSSYNSSVTCEKENSGGSSCNKQACSVPLECGTIKGDSKDKKWTNKDRTITVSCSGGTNGCSSVTKTYNYTKKTDTIVITDGAGNTKKCDVDVYVDKTPPTCKIGGDSTTWTNSNRTITRTCIDSDSGCNTYTSGDSKIFKTTTEVGTLTPYTMKDNVGNTTTCATSAKVYVDKTPPACKIEGESTTWTNKDRTITRTCSDSHSGCDPSASGDSRTFSATTMRATLSAYTVKDKAGNTKACVTSVNVYVDKTPPSVSILEGPKGMACGGAAGLFAKYKVTDDHSEISEVRDWWGSDSSTFDYKSWGIIRPKAYGVNEFTKEHNWSKKCTQIGEPDGSCYYIKIYAKDKVDNETEFISTTCAERK